MHGFPCSSSTQRQARIGYLCPHPLLALAHNERLQKRCYEFALSALEPIINGKLQVGASPPMISVDVTDNIEVVIYIRRAFSKILVFGNLYSSSARLFTYLENAPKSTIATSRWDWPIRIAWTKGVASPVRRKRSCYDVYQIPEDAGTVVATDVKCAISHFHEVHQVFPFDCSEYFERLIAH